MTKKQIRQRLQDLLQGAYGGYIVLDSPVGLGAETFGRFQGAVAIAFDIPATHVLLQQSWHCLDEWDDLDKLAKHIHGAIRAGII